MENGLNWGAPLSSLDDYCRSKILCSDDSDDDSASDTDMIMITHDFLRAVNPVRSG